LQGIARGVPFVRGRRTLEDSGTKGRPVAKLIEALGDANGDGSVEGRREHPVSARAVSGIAAFPRVLSEQIVEQGFRSPEIRSFQLSDRLTEFN